MDNGQVLGEIRLACSVQHSERLFRSVDFLFDYVPFTLADVDLFVAARGPGSFTGLRLGLAAMEGFAAAHGKPGAGVSTLEALAWKSGVEGSVIAPVIDARRGEIYGGLYRRDGETLTEVQPPVVMKPEEWFGALLDGPDGPDLAASPVVFCGDGALRYREFLNREGWSLHEMDMYLAGAVARLAESPNRGPLSPLYVRRTEAEMARERAS